MKKTLIASAVAAAALSTSAFAMDNAADLASKLDAMPTVYGNIQLAYVYDDQDPGGSNSELADNGSTIGFKHSHMIAPGWTGFVKAELEFDADDKATSGGLDSFDEAYIGVKSDEYGKAWVGSDDSTHEVAVDVISNYWELGDGSLGAADYDTGEGDSIQYITPSMSGFQVAAQVQINGSGEGKAANTDGENSYPYQLAVYYTMDALTVAASMDSNDGQYSYSSEDASLDDKNTYGLRATYDMDNFSITGEFHTREDNVDQYGLMGNYTMGANTFAIGYVYKDFDSKNVDQGSGDSQGIGLQALHNVSDYIYVWSEYYYANQDTDAVDDVDTNVFATGVTYLF